MTETNSSRDAERPSRYDAFMGSMDLQIKFEKLKRLSKDGNSEEKDRANNELRQLIYDELPGPVHDITGTEILGNKSIEQNSDIYLGRLREDVRNAVSGGEGGLEKFLNEIPEEVLKRTLQSKKVTGNIPEGNLEAFRQYANYNHIKDLQEHFERAGLEGMKNEDRDIIIDLVSNSIASEIRESDAHKAFTKNYSSELAESSLIAAVNVVRRRDFDKDKFKSYAKTALENEVNKAEEAYSGAKKELYNGTRAALGNYFEANRGEAINVIYGAGKAVESEESVEAA